MGAISRHFGERPGVAPLRRYRAAVLADGAGLDDEAVGSERATEVAVVGGILRIDPDHDNSRRAQEIHQPIERRLERLDRALPPVDQRHVVLSGRQAAICRRRHANMAAAMQLEHQLGALRSRHDDALQLRAAREREHRFDDALAGANETSLNHGCHRSGRHTILKFCSDDRYAARATGAWVPDAASPTARGLRLISSSRTSGTMMTAWGRLPFSNMANFRASARSTNRPPRSPL